VRQYRIDPPPPSGNAKLDSWLLRVFDAINSIPATSSFSGDPNAIGVPAMGGTLGFDTNSASTAFLWVNKSGTSTSWSSIVYG
jgi:hypothetical protein